MTDRARWRPGSSLPYWLCGILLATTSTGQEPTPTLHQETIENVDRGGGEKEGERASRDDGASAEPLNLRQRREQASVLHNGSRRQRHQAVLHYETIVADAKQAYSQADLPGGHSEIIQSLTDLAAAYGTVTRYRDAIRAQDEALQMCHQRFPESEWPVGAVSTADCTLRLAQYHVSVGDHDKFDSLLSEADRILDSSGAEPTFEHASVRMDLGFLFVYKRDLSQARKHCLIAADMAAGLASVPAHYQDNLAVLYAKCSWVLLQSLQYDKAKSYASRALQIAETLPEGKVHEMKAQTLRCLGNVCRSLRQFDEAVGYFDRAHQMFQKTRINEAGKLAVETARCHLQLGDLKNADRWLTIAEQYQGVQSPNKSSLLGVRGQWRLAKGQNEAARKSLVSALDPTPDRPGYSRDLADIHLALGRLELRENRAAEAATWFEQVWRQRADEFASVIPAASETYALEVLADHWRISELYLQATQAETTPEQVRHQYAMILQQRGLVGRVVALRNRMRQSLPAEQADSYSEYVKLSNRVAEMGTRRRDAEADQEFRTLLSRQETLDQRLSQQIPRLVDAIRGLHISLSDLQATIDGHERLIDYVRYQTDSGASYAVFVVSANAVNRIDIADAGKIDRMAERYRRHLIEGKHDRETSRQLEQQLIAPLIDYLPSSVTTLHLCAEGTLCRLPWAALEREDATIMLERYVIAIPPSPHVLMERDRRGEGEGRELLVVGDVDYGAVSMNRNDGTEDEAVSVDRRTWQRLPETKSEVAEVVRLAGGSEVVASRLEGTGATVTRFLAALPEARWVHVATHGYSDPPTSGREAAGIDPLRNCGLVFAGANLRPRLTGTAENADRPRDVTGATICNLDLSDAELVFLSACDSGVGDVHGGEGMFGLQRAFHHAGASHVICSLWQIDDAATAILVQKFYENYWANGRNAAKALREAQLAVYRDPLAVEQFAASRGLRFQPVSGDSAPAPTSPPRLWAGFILSGYASAPGRHSRDSTAPPASE